MLRTLLYRDHRDFVVHLAVDMAQLSEADLFNKANAGETCDLLKATEADKIEARAVLTRAGIRTRDDTPPAWHFAKPA